MREFPEYDFLDFHRQELPQRLLDGNGRLAAFAAKHLQPLTVSIRGSSLQVCYMPRESTIDIVLEKPSQAISGTHISMDIKSWWGKGADGDEVLCRVLQAGTNSVFKDLPNYHPC